MDLLKCSPLWTDNSSFVTDYIRHSLINRMSLTKPFYEKQQSDFEVLNLKHCSKDLAGYGNNNFNSFSRL